MNEYKTSVFALLKTDKMEYVWYLRRPEQISIESELVTIGKLPKFSHQIPLFF